MASEIDSTVFPDDQKVDKADLREQFQIAGREITALQDSVALPRQLMFNESLWDTL